MRAFFALLLAGAPLFAAIDGVVINGTSGNAQASVAVSLVQPGAGGMKNLANTKSDGEGKFRFDVEIPPGPALLQAVYQGVTYNTVITPGMPRSGVRLSVNEATKDVAAAEVTQHLILLEPGSDGLSVSETVFVNNGTAMSYLDSTRGTVQFYLPRESNGVAEVTINAPGGMPIRRPAEQTSTPGMFKVSYPAKPGETRFDVRYMLPATTRFASKVVGSAPLRLVTPAAVTLTGDTLKDLGQEPQTQAHIYSVTGASFDVEMAGSGSLRENNAKAAPASPDEDPGMPQVKPGRPRIYSRMYWVIGLALGILAVGGTMLFRRGAA